jgi:hypothetical protein
VSPTCQTPHAAPGPLGSVPLPQGCHAPRRSHTLRQLSGPRAARPHVSRHSPLTRPPHAAHRSPCPSCRRPNRRGPKPLTPGPSPCHLAARPSPSCRAAVPAPVSRPVPRSSPVRRWAPPLGRRAAPPPRATPLCDWAERGFGLVALGLDFIFSEYIQFLANSKICVGFI